MGFKFAPTILLWRIAVSASLSASYLRKPNKVKNNFTLGNISWKEDLGPSQLWKGLMRSGERTAGLYGQRPSWPSISRSSPEGWTRVNTLGVILSSPGKGLCKQPSVARNRSPYWNIQVSLSTGSCPTSAFPYGIEETHQFEKLLAYQKSNGPSFKSVSACHIFQHGIPSLSYCTLHVSPALRGVEGYWFSFRLGALPKHGSLLAHGYIFIYHPFNNPLTEIYGISIKCIREYRGV